jgi:hypothetical protein
MMGIAQICFVRYREITSIPRTAMQVSACGGFSVARRTSWVADAVLAIQKAIQRKTNNELLSEALRPKPS